MGSTRISLIRGTSKSYEIDLTDEDGLPIAPALLLGATAAFDLKNQPSDPTDVLGFTTDANPASLAFKASALLLNFAADDTAILPLQVYTWRLAVTLSNGDRLDAVEWSPFDLNLGGTAAETPPAFDNTVKVNQDFGLPDALQYLTPGGTPICDAQIRVYYKSDYDVGKLDNPVGITMTKKDGRWANPVLVLPGYNYVIQFFKPGEFGPDVSTIIA